MYIYLNISQSVDQSSCYYILIYFDININMVKLSQYSNGYEEGKFELMPWEFWTEEEKSQVIYQAYKDHYLTSKEVKHYLDVGRTHMITQFLVPALAGVSYFGFMKKSIASTLYRRSPTIGNAAGVVLLGIVTIAWVNLSPFYTRKEKQQEKLLDHLYHKIGTTMKGLNDLVPRTRTSTDIDVRSRMLYSQRNGIFAGILFPDEDSTPPIEGLKKYQIHEEKRTYL